MEQTFKFQPLFVWCTFIILAASSCVSTKKVKQYVYLNDLSDSIAQKVVAEYEPKILPGDRLTITVGALNSESAIIYNQPVTSNLATSPSAIQPGYLVNSEGIIQLPQLGNMKVEGLTRQQLVDTLTNIYKVYLKDPLVSVQLTNFRITVLGDVAAPGTKVISEGKVNLLEAIGLSGDLTMYGRRSNILVIREKDGRREFGRVDLTSSNLFKSPYYNLQQNDVIYVEMTKTKIDASDQTVVRNVSIAASLVSLLATVIILIVNISQ